VPDLAGVATAVLSGWLGDRRRFQIVLTLDRLIAASHPLVPVIARRRIVLPVWIADVQKRKKFSSRCWPSQENRRSPRMI
jgi:hypothetical protein